MMGDYSIPIIEPTIDYTKVPPINQKRTITFINHFIVHTVTFLNKFALTCEERLFEFENKLQRVQASLEILESRLSSIPGLETERKTTQDENQKQEVKLVEIVREGTNESDIEVPKEIKNEEKELQPESQPISADPRYQKYFKMLQFGVPKPAVKLKMQQEGLDSSLIDNPQQLVPIGSNTES
ncbi:WASH complex subunit 3 [Belonocnema kinseyi]|uniref:WASH complex subunit 3 n=1 Tax=Belonocnema kinseyi TaxID=2817044 RepID=UPI00143CFB20|nr:WASH complex subunit 3 [Belonocnema kinseyi]